MTQHPLAHLPARGQGAWCQSCGSPFGTWAGRGTEGDGGPSARYCRLCYAEGRFLIDCSMDDMLQVASARLAFVTGMPVTRAQGLLGGALPHLERWRRTA